MVQNAFILRLSSISILQQSYDRLFFAKKLYTHTHTDCIPVPNGWRATNRVHTQTRSLAICFIVLMTTTFPHVVYNNSGEGRSVYCVFWYYSSQKTPARKKIKQKLKTARYNSGPRTQSASRWFQSKSYRWLACFFLFTLQLYTNKGATLLYIAQSFTPPWI